MTDFNVNVPTQIDNNLTPSTTQGASKTAINTGLSTVQSAAASDATTKANAALSSANSYTDSGLANKQPLDSDLTSIAGLTPSNDDIIQRKAGSWVNRTLAQLWVDLKDLAITLTNKTLAVASNSITGTASRVAQFGAGGSLEAGTVTTTTLGYLDATSSIQGQLDLKTGLEPMFGSTAVFSPTDGAVGFVGLTTTLAPTGLASARPFQGWGGSCYGMWLYVDPTSAVGSTEDVTYEIYNATDSVVVSGTVATLKYDARGKISYTVFASAVTLSASKYYSIRITNPTFATNPTNVVTLGKLLMR